tara:strand:- start:38232 stop:39101 length:870 start_codon:yes stop_codon:yes gene_type:complete
MSSINLVIKPNSKDLGDNFLVRRLIPIAKKRMIGPFIFWDHMGPVNISESKKMKVRSHPHIGLSTLTYLFSGEIMHRDSLGNIQAIRPGEVNWMTAGSGIVHSERAGDDGQEQVLEGLQIWIALPKESEDIAASFVHIKEQDLPSIKIPGGSLKLIAGEFMQEKSSVPVFSPLFYTNGNLKLGHTFSYALGENEESALYILSGEVEIEGKLYGVGDMVCFNAGAICEFKAQKDLNFMFFGGEIFLEKRFIWWNFVSSEKEKIENAKVRWQNQEFGQVIDETEYIELPKD